MTIFFFSFIYLIFWYLFFFFFCLFWVNIICQSFLFTHLLLCDHSLCIACHLWVLTYRIDIVIIYIDIDMFSINISGGMFIIYFYVSQMFRFIYMYFVTWIFYMTNDDFYHLFFIFCIIYIIKTVSKFIIAIFIRN